MKKCSGQIGRFFICEKRNTCLLYNPYRLFSSTPELIYHCKDYIDKNSNSYYLRKNKIKNIIKNIK